MDKIRIFLGSSSEAADKSNPEKNILLKIAGILRNAGAEPVLWNQQPSIFDVGKTTIENLETLVSREKIEASVFIYSTDDKTWSRGEIKDVPRDNVVFEHGLFAGILGRTKAITINVGNTKIPSDLHGVTCIYYSENPEHAALNIMQWVNKLLIDRIPIESKNKITNSVIQQPITIKSENKDITTLFGENTIDKNINFSEETSLIDSVTIDKGTYYCNASKTRISIEEGFAISKYLVTQALYEKIMNSNPSNFKGDLRPVENVSWFDAIEFCNKLTEVYNLEKVYDFDKGSSCIMNKSASGFRLPFIEEWEYACLGGECRYPTEHGEIEQIAWFNKNSSAKTHAVGEKIENGYGLFDMLGNVNEWCYCSIFNASEKQDSNSKKVFKGGSWTEFENNLSHDSTRKEFSNIKKNTIGFRVVKNI